MNMFFELLSSFPKEEFQGYFSHYEKHLELKWVYEEETNNYLLIFIDLGTIFTLKSNVHDLEKFGVDLKKSLDAAPIKITTSENLTIILQKKTGESSWTNVAQSFNSGSQVDTCALNPINTGAGYYQLIIKTVADTTNTKEGLYSYTDWNN